MSSPYDDPYGKIYTRFSIEWGVYPWSSEPVFIPQVFHEHFVLVLGWTSGRHGYVSTVTITPDVPDGANPDHYLRIRAPRRRSAADEGTVTLRKNKTVSALVEHLYVRLDWVCEVPVAMLSAVPRMGMQLMLRPASMEKIMSFYSSAWGWDQAAWAQTTDRFPMRYRQRSEGGDRHDPNASWGLPGGWSTSHTPDNDSSGQSTEEQGSLPCARQEMVYAGDAHCAALAKLLQEARSCSFS